MQVMKDLQLCEKAATILSSLFNHTRVETDILCLVLRYDVGIFLTLADGMYLSL